jgi:hypothetical protein
VLAGHCMASHPKGQLCSQPLHQIELTSQKRYNGDGDGDGDGNGDGGGDGGDGDGDGDGDGGGDGSDPQQTLCLPPDQAIWPHHFWGCQGW